MSVVIRGDCVNKAFVMGKVQRLKGLRYTQEGHAVLQFRVVTTESYLDKDKVRRDRTDWHNVVVWGKRGEALAKMIQNGGVVFVVGAMRICKYEKDGKKLFRRDLLAQDVSIVEKDFGFDI